LKLADLAYCQVEGAPGRYFRCDRYGLMRDEACARSFLAAPEAARGGRLTGCVGCEVGRAHAAAPTEAGGAIAPQVCVRCRRSAADIDTVGRVRFVRGLICVSCFNREREVVLGRDRKGNRPGLVLCPYEVAVVDASRRLAPARLPLARDRVEVALTAIRQRGAATLVGWASPGLVQVGKGGSGCLGS
jgi:hypothetical protein